MARRKRTAASANSSLTMRDLEAMAQNAITHFIVLASRRIAREPETNTDLSRFLMSG